MMIDTFPWVGEMSEEAYHSDAQLPHAALSHSLAHTLISRSPAHARAKCRKLNPLGVREEADKFDRGHAAHVVLFGGGDEMLCVVDADDWRAKAAKDAKASARAAGLYPILRHQHDTILRMADVMRDTLFRCPDLAGLDLGAGKTEQSVIWRDGEILLRIRPDWWNEERDVIVDYKTTDGSAHPNAWMRTMLATGADLQEALYREGNAATGGAKKALFLFAVQESEEPHACSLVALDTAFKAFSEEKIIQAKEEWRACMRTGEWPSYPRRICHLQPPGWAITQYLENHTPMPDSHGIAYDPTVLYDGAMK